MIILPDTAEIVLIVAVAMALKSGYIIASS